MTKIPAKNIAPGMRLKRPVINRNGLTMIGENTELTEDLIEKIRKMEDVPTVEVHGVTLTRISREEAVAALDERFMKVENAAYMHVIKRVLREHLESLYEAHGPENAQE